MKDYCSICKTPMQDTFCATCGQKHSNKRTTFLSIITDYITQILSLERSGFATIIQLIIYPKKVVENYWNGYRNYFQSPGKILFYFLTIAGLQIVLVSPKLFDLTISAGIISPQFVFIIIIPLLSLTSYLTYKKHGLHYGEHFIAQTYLFSVFGILFIIVGNVFDYLLKFNLGIFNFFFMLLIILLWSVFVFSKKRKWYFLILNFLLELVVFISIISILITLGYFSGGVDIK